MDHKVVQLSSLVFIVVVVKPTDHCYPFPIPPPPCSSLIVSIFALAEQKPLDSTFHCLFETIIGLVMNLL